MSSRPLQREDHVAVSPATRAQAPACVDVILRDGATLRLREPTAADGPALLAFFARLSPTSRHFRFHGAYTAGDAFVSRYLTPTPERGALVALVDADGGERIAALAEYAVLRDATTAEVAFTVADDLQGRGIGTRLLEQLASKAAAAGVERFVAEVLAGNRGMLSVFQDAGFDVSRRLEAGEVEVTFAIAPTETYRRRVDERDHIAVVASLEPFFRPRSVAVVGASRRRGSIGGELFRNILDADFAGAAYPVNRGGEPVAGVRAYTSITAVPERVDLAVLCVPGEHVLDAAREALAAGVRALCVISSGFAETGPEGHARQEALLAAARAHGARIVGPNCLGIAVPAIGLNATFAPRQLPAGGIGFSSQSGALGLALLEKAAERSLGFSSFVSIGNKADVSSNDLLEWWEDDDATALVLLYLESFGNPQKFGRIATRVSRRKPILALKAGTTGAGARAASSHTAALAGSDSAVDALFRHAGVQRLDTLEELVDAAALLSRQPLPRGPRVGVVTNAGGLGILCADACERAGLTLPDLRRETKAALADALPGEASTGNPVDLLGSATAATYRAAVGPVLADENVDALIVLFVPPVVAGAEDVAQAIRDTVVAAGPIDKPVLAVVVSADGIPAALRDPASPVTPFPFPESAARALGVARRRADWLARPLGELALPDGISLEAARDAIEESLARSDDRWLEPAEARRLLEALGVPVVAERDAATVDAAVSAAEAIGYPVVLKTAAAGAHKTETGGVALDLASADEVREAAERIGGPVVVQKMVGGGIELLAGIVRDPVFGPLVAFGAGGVLAELIGDAGIRTAPLTDVDAAELVTTGKAGRLVAGYRGTPAADVAALVDLVERLSALAVELPEVAELDLNPVIADAAGCVAVDARIRVARPAPASRTKTW
ncbi:MAG TPA: GNAT family N-acetyltransferase [Gaiellaceae bacterium]|nr:GNAT family N-acetyltransferase [Gaiellaceae bacterium]